MCTISRGSVGKVVRAGGLFKIYELQLTMRAPGRNAASTKPRKKRVATMPAKLCVTPERVETIPQRSMMTEIYSDGRLIVLINMLEGTCVRI